MVADLPPRQGEERSDLEVAGFPMTTSVSTPAQTNQMLQPHSLYVTVLHWIWGSHYYRGDSTLRCRGHEVLWCNLGGAGGSHCWHLLKELHHRSPPYTCQELTWVMPAINCNFTTGCRQLKLGEVICCGGQMEHAPNVASEWREGNKYVHLHRQGTGDSSDLSVTNTGQEPARTPHSSVFPSLGQGSWCREKGKHTLKGNRDNSGQPSGLLLQQLGIRSHPQ